MLRRSLLIPELSPVSPGCHACYSALWGVPTLVSRVFPLTVARYPNQSVTLPTVTWVYESRLDWQGCTPPLRSFTTEMV
jgi:hypothetical protein